MLNNQGGIWTRDAGELNRHGGVVWKVMQGMKKIAIFNQYHAFSEMIQDRAIVTMECE